MADSQFALSNQNIDEQLRKCKKQKHVESYPDLDKFMANMAQLKERYM